MTKQTPMSNNGDYLEAYQESVAEKCTHGTAKVTSIKKENSPANLATLLNSVFPPESGIRLLNLATMPSLSGPDTVTTYC